MNNDSQTNKKGIDIEKIKEHRKWIKKTLLKPQDNI